jgi:hypothetical protein
MRADRTRATRARNFWWIAGITVLLLVAGGVAYLTLRSDRWAAPKRSDVLAVWIQPAPEGPAGLPFTSPGAAPWAIFNNGGDLGRLLPYVPDPLPHPSRQWFCSGSGYYVHFLLVGGRGVDFGPCRRPASIENLRSQMEGLWSAATS